MNPLKMFDKFNASVINELFAKQGVPDGTDLIILGYTSDNPEEQGKELFKTYSLDKLIDYVFSKRFDKANNQYYRMILQTFYKGKLTNEKSIGKSIDY